MGCWGMGLTQSDEFCEVYDQFMEAYNEGKEVSDITAAILEQYHEEFNDSDGAMHDVYFALAKAEWICCAQSEMILSKVKYIIENDLNIDFYRELMANESDLKLRRKNLQIFWDKLQTPRKSAKKRVSPPKRTVLDKGTLFWYKKRSNYFAAIVLDIVNRSFLVALSEPLNVAPKTTDSVLNARARTASWFDLLLSEKQIHIVNIIDIKESYNGRAGIYFNADIGIYYCGNCGSNQQWDGCNDHNNHWIFPNMTLRDMLSAENLPVTLYRGN